MRDPFTRSGLRTPNDLLVIQLERLSEDLSPYLKKLYLDSADQEFMFHEFMCVDPLSTSSWIFDQLKVKLEIIYPNLVLERSDLHIERITHYIGYLRGLWETRQPQPAGKLPVRVSIDAQYGLNILVGIRTGPGYFGSAVSFNPNGQRLVYNLRRENKSILKVYSGFVDKLLEESPLGFRHDVEIEHVDVLLVFMERQVEEPMDGQADHWRWVTRPYDCLGGDVPTYRLRQSSPRARRPAAEPVEGLRSLSPLADAVDKVDKTDNADLNLQLHGTSNGKDRDEKSVMPPERNWRRNFKQRRNLGI